MSQKMLYHAFRVSGYRLLRWEYEQHRIFVHLEPQEHKVCCSSCGSRDVIRRGSETRHLRNVSIQSDMTWLVVRIPRVQCKACGLTRQIRTGLCPDKRTYTHAFVRHVVELCQLMPLKSVALYLGIGWDMVKDIHKQSLQTKFARPALKDLKEIAIDEIHLGRGRWKTIVLDLASGAIVFVGEGKNAESVGPFLRSLRKRGARVRAVAVDFGKAYIAAVQKFLPGAVLVFDRFHLVKLFNEKLTQLRRELYREAEGPLQKKVLKGTRWLLLKRPDNLDDSRNEPQRLQEALELNEPLAAAYYLKEDLCAFWEQENRAAAAVYLRGWYQAALASGIRLIQDLARFVMAHQHGLLAWYDHPISTGPLEGTNRKIRTLNATHYGFRDQEYFNLRLYNLHHSQVTLIG